MRRRESRRFPKWVDVLIVGAAIGIALRLDSLAAGLLIGAVILVYGVVRDVDFSRK